MIWLYLTNRFNSAILFSRRSTMTIGLNYEGRRIGELKLRKLPQPGDIIKVLDVGKLQVLHVRTAEVGENKASAAVRPA